MERLNKSHQEAGDIDPGLKADIVRHGPSSYRQPEWRDIDTAEDLNTLGMYQDGDKTAEEIRQGHEKAIEIVRTTAEKIAAEIESDEEVAIWASPTGRTLETARIISEVLREKGIKLRQKGLAKEHGINIFERLGEVKNFQWKLFVPLVDGGEIDFNGERFFIDKDLANPEGLSYQDYFTSDAIQEIPSTVKKQWPENYVKAIESFESFKEVSQRMKKVLSRVKNNRDKKYRVIMVTHDALTGDLVKTFTHDQLSGVNPGQLVALERVGDDLIVTQVGDITEGDREQSVA